MTDMPSFLIISKYNQTLYRVCMHGCNLITVYNYSLLFKPCILHPDKFLAKFNPWTNAFGNRLARLHCLRIHPHQNYIPVVYREK